MAELTEEQRKLVEAPNFAYIGLPRDDGSALVAPVWVDINDAGQLELNSAEGRAWPALARKHGKITVTVPDKDSPYTYVSVTGPIVEDTHEGAREHIDALARKYMDVDEYPNHQPGEQRIIFRVQPDRVRYRGPS
jgi:PPOX class probable F420-dependent enzyme